MTELRDTIFALATAPGKAGVAIVRVSGPEAIAALEDLAGAPPPPRYMSLRNIRDGDDLIDQALIVRFEAGVSYTGDDVVEFHVHGGKAVVSRLFSALLARNLRIAEPGEFTRRAFEVGALDLTQVEAVADLVDADTEAQRRQAVALVEGALSDEVRSLQGLAREILANLEASIDFADEEDAPFDVSDIVKARLDEMSIALQRLIKDAEIGKEIREGFSVALVGPPNVGKSSLINALSRTETSIVSPYEGTTRDVMSANVSIEGLPVTLLDTAGLRETDDPVEAIGIRLAIQSAQDAHLRLHMRSADTGGDISTDLWRDGDIRIWAKADLGEGVADLSVSIEDEASVEAVRKAVAEKLLGGQTPSSIVAHERQLGHLLAASRLIEDAAGDCEPEVQAHLVRESVRKLSGVLGEVDIEDVLGDIFSRFCIGK